MSPLSVQGAACALLFFCLGASAPSDDSLCLRQPGERIRARIDPEATRFASGSPVSAHLTIELFGPAGSLRVRTEGMGSIARGATERTLAGPWPSGSTTELDLTIAPIGSGPGQWRASVDALDDFGQVIQSHQARLFVEVDDQATWASGSSDVDLALSRLASLRREGRLSEGELARGREAVTRGRATPGPRPDPVRAPTLAEQRVRQVYRAMGVASGPPRAASGSTSVVGNVMWTDSMGGTHPLPMAHVEALDGSTVLGSSTTDASGAYGIGLGADAANVTVRVFARSVVADVTPDADMAQTYSVDSDALAISAGSQGRIDLTIGNTTTVESAFSVHAGLVLIGGYMGPLAGSLPSHIDVRFPTTLHTSLFSRSTRELHLQLGDRFDWDVLHHEYGHYVMNIYGFVNSPGGPHSMASNLAARPEHDKDAGTRLAWGEGWPTFFGIIGQMRMGGASLGIPNVGDTIYTTTEDSIWSMDIEVTQGLGEDDELSVATCLMDLVDATSDGLEDFQRDDTSLFQAFSQLSPVTLGQAWNAFGGALAPRERAEAGAAFAQANAAPELTAPADRYRPESSPPVFRWKKNGLGNPDPHNDFKIVFWDREFEDKVFEKELGDVDEWTPTGAEWNQILDGGEIVNWVVEGKNTTSPESPGGELERYWSQSRRLGGVGIAFVIDDTDSMQEEIESVQAALQDFITELEGELDPDERPPTIQVVSFKDSVTERIVSSDLEAVRGTVASLFASGGQDCPEVGAQAIQFAAQSLGQAGTILFATDASNQSGTNIQDLAEMLLERGIEVHVILSGDCFSLSVSDEGSPCLPCDAEALAWQPWAPPEPPARSPGEPGGPDVVDPPQEPIDDDGQEPFDDHGDTPQTATLLIEDAPPLLAFTDSSEIDWFALDLEGGVEYFLRFTSLDFHSVRLRTYEPDGITEIDRATSLDSNVLVWKPGATGRYYLTASSPETRYTLFFERNSLPLLQSGVQVYSFLAAESGGAFFLQDDMDLDQYAGSMLNVMLASIRPTVTRAVPNTLPRSSTLGLTLTASRTTWNSSTSLEVLAAGVEVESVDVLSPKRLQAVLTLEPDATLGRADVVVSTPVGGGFEEARGLAVVEITEAVPFTMLISVQPASAARGETLDLSMYGARSFWDSSSTFDLGPGISVNSVTPISSTRLDANVTVAADATIGFRTAIVGTLGNEDELEQGFLVVHESLNDTGFQGIDPPTAQRGSRLVVTVRTEGTSFANGVTTADFGPQIEVVNVEVFSPTHAEVEIEIPVNTPLGFRDVTLTTGADVFLAEDEFFVDDFTSVRSLSGGLAKLSESLSAFGTVAFEFQATSGQTLERLFVVPFGDGTGGTVPAPDVELSLVSPSSTIVTTQRSSSSAIDLADVMLTETGTYRIVVADRGGSGGSYKGVALLAGGTTP